MTAAALILYGFAALFFILAAGRVTWRAFELVPAGLFCLALLWFLQVLIPLVNR